MRAVMHAWMLQHVSIWLEDALANEVAFSHALEWAFRLHLPLRVVAITQPPVMDKMKAWGELAALRGVALETHLNVEKTPGAIEQFLRTICVFSDTADTEIEQELLQRTSRIPTVFAEAEVSQAELDKYTVQLGFATITAPFDGVVTHRSSFPGDFVRSANEGGGHEPILTVQRTDKMRVVVQVPDRDVPFADPGDTAIVAIDSLGGKKIHAKISRIAKSEDPLTRLMHIEIDLPNPDGKICHGMYGKVSIVLDKSADQLSIPSACLVGRAENGTGAVYVVRDKHARLVKVQLGIDNGVQVGILSGLDTSAEVILQPGSAVSEGSLLNPTCDEVVDRKTAGNR